MRLQGLFVITFACVSLLTAALAPISTQDTGEIVAPVTAQNETEQNCVTFGFEVEGESIGCVQPVLATMGKGFFKTLTE